MGFGSSNKNPLAALNAVHGLVVPSYPSSVTDRPLEADEIGLLRTMVEADEVASSQGLHDESFIVIMLREGAFIGHKGLGAERRSISRRAFLGLRDAGLFVLVSEKPHLVRLYLVRDARKRLDQHTSRAADTPPGEPSRAARRPGRPSGPYLIQSREEIEAAYRSLWTRTDRRPTWRQLAIDIGVDERTLKQARHRYGVVAEAIQRDRPDKTTV